MSDEEAASADFSRPIRTLLVEDDAGYAALIRRYLASSVTTSFEIAVVERLSAASERLSDEPFDLVVLDLSLPDSFGLDTLRRLREDAPEVPLVVMTGLEDEELAVSTVALGAHGYVAKSEASTAVLVRELRHAIERHRMVRELEAARELARSQAVRDPLTGLANRLLLEDRLRTGLATARRSGHSLAVMMLDLDHFKHINDTFGHAAGDDVLKEVARRLRESVRESDTVARLGGDEFVVLLTRLGSEAGTAGVAEKLLGILQRPVPHHGNLLPAGASIGIATFPATGEDTLTLLKAADMALYEVKRRGRGRFCFYDERMSRERERRFHLDGSLSSAVERDELVLHYQPVIDLRSERIVGAEALLRWRRGSQLLSPSEFLPAAEETGHILRIGQWALGEACRQARAWLGEDADRFFVAVNLSSGQLRLADMCLAVRRALDESGLAPERLLIEVTEDALIDGSTQAWRTARRIRELGVRIALDDFGTGYSCLASLRHLPLDVVKIDPTFVAGLPHDGPAAALTSTIVSMAKGFRAETIAEGVESAEQIELLRELGCGQAQGFLFSPPLPAEAFAALRSGASPGWWRKPRS